MPHITKYREKMRCIRPKEETWERDLEFKYILPTARQASRVLQIPEPYLNIVKSLPSQHQDSTQDKNTLFNLIENIVSNTLTSNMKSDEFLKDFVEIKEVPYGRYNSDSDYRGS